MADTLKGKKIAILVADGFEQSEFQKPKQALDDAGAQTQVVSPAGNKVKGWDVKEWGDEVKVDVSTEISIVGNMHPSLTRVTIAAVSKPSTRQPVPSSQRRQGEWHVPSSTLRE